MKNDMKAYKKALDDRHGKLLSCSAHSSTSGMMINSNSILNYELDIKDNDASVLKVTNKKAFEKTFVTSYRIKDEDLNDLYTFIEENRFWAFSELEYYQDPRFIVYDYSSSSSISLRYDDSQIGGDRFTYLSINADAMDQKGFNEQSAAFFKKMASLMEKGEFLTSEESGENSNFFAGNNKQETELTADGEVCPCCGYKPVEGKFCPECGSKVKN